MASTCHLYLNNNYIEETNITIADAIRTSMLVNRVHGEVQAHFLLTNDLNNPDFNKAAKIVEEYYRNVYIDNELTANTNTMKGNTTNEKGSTARKDKRDIHTHTTLRGTGQGKYQSRPYYIKGKNPYHNTGSYGSYNTYGLNPGRYNKYKGKSKGSQKGHMTTVTHNNKTKEKERMEKVRASIATFVDDRATLVTSVGGEDRLIIKSSFSGIANPRFTWDSDA
eukprot:5173520-Amphidinium_carterae.1